MTKTTIQLDETLPIFHARQYAYDILRRFFLEEPSREYLKVFIEKDMIALFPFQEDAEELREGVKDIKDYLLRYDPVQNEADYDALHWDYTRMFIGPHELTTPPWESSYVEKGGLLFQETTLDVRKYYDKFGIVVSDYNIEADDHIGLQLDFIFQLNKMCGNIAESNDKKEISMLKQIIEEQETFLEEHLLQFVPEFSKLVEKEAETQFYVGLAKLLRQYLLMDSQVLKELLNIEII